jgi:hypothetical protein
MLHKRHDATYLRFTLFSIDLRVILFFTDPRIFMLQHGSYKSKLSKEVPRLPIIKIVVVNLSQQECHLSLAVSVPIVCVNCSISTKLCYLSNSLIKLL